jgi:hypothetical protein
MKLQEIRVQRTDHIIKELLVRVDQQRHTCRPPCRAPHQRDCRVNRNVARAFGKKHETEEIGPGLKRGVDALPIGKPADLDPGWHGGSVAQNRKKVQ